MAAITHCSSISS